MTSHFDGSGGDRRRVPGTAAGREDPAGSGPRTGPQPVPRPPVTGAPGSPAGPRPDSRDARPGGAPNAGPAAAGTTQPAGPPAGPDNGVVINGENDLEAARRERDEYLDMLRRVQADFENYKKRMQRQQTDQLERASENLVAKLLPALDAFDLSVAHLPAAEAASAEVKALLQASGLVIDALAKEGLERIDVSGAPFDPTVHDAVEHAPADDASAAAAGTIPGGSEAVESGPVVADVLRPGYRWKGRVIRPAMVRVRG